MARTQNSKVYDYMKEHGSIDTCRAMYDLGVFRLSARISDLKSLGVPIKTVRKTKQTSEGQKTWAEYSLDE